jgi:type VI protein secretion system component VasK
VSKFRQFLVYSKATLLLAGLLALLLLVFKNRSYTTQFWPGAADQPVSTLWIMLLTAILSIVAWSILLRVRRIWKELRDVRAEKARLAEQARLEQRSQQLEQQEKRIDEKLRRGLDPNNSQGG